MGYYHGNKGRGLWFTPYVTTPGGAPITIRTTEYDIDRYGIVASSLFTLGDNQIELGMWYEDNDFNQARRFYGLADTAGAPSRGSLKFPKDPLATQWEFDFNTQTLQYHVQDTLDLGALRINAGVEGAARHQPGDPDRPRRSGLGADRGEGLVPAAGGPALSPERR